MIRIMLNLFLFTSLLAAAKGNSAERPDPYITLRENMVSSQIAARGIKDPRVLSAMRSVPRHLFMPESNPSMAYNDTPVPIGEGQTISQPYIVAFMTEILELRPDDRILEIGTGSGYQAAVLAELVQNVFTIEIIPVLGNRASKLLEELGYENIHVKIGNGYKGWPEEAPFDAVIVTAAPENIPEALVEQLKEGGKMIIPVGRRFGVQRMILGVKENGLLRTENVLDVRFVPMVGGN